MIASRKESVDEKPKEEEEKLVNIEDGDVIDLPFNPNYKTQNPLVSKSNCLEFSI